MKRSQLVALQAVLLVGGLAACGDSGGNNPGDKADQKTSNLVAKDVSDVTKQVGDQAGAQAGKADVGVNGSSLAGNIPGAAGGVAVSGTVQAGANGFDIASTLDFKGYQGPSGVVVSGQIAAHYTLTVDISDPLNPSIEFSSTVKGNLSTADGKTVVIDMTISSANGQLTCGGSANGFVLAASCGATTPPASDLGTPPPAGDIGTPPTPDAGIPPLADAGSVGTCTQLCAALAADSSDVDYACVSSEMTIDGKFLGGSACASYASSKSAADCAACMSETGTGDATCADYAASCL